MRILVIGTGIIGSIYGWALAESGHQVVHLVRSGRAAGLRDGMALDVFDRRKRHKRNFHGVYRLDAVETISPTDNFELVIVPVKHYALLQSPKGIVPRVGTADFLLLTQNWQGTSQVDAILPRTRYVYGDAKAGGTITNGKLVAALSAIDIGPAEGEPSGMAKKAASLFDSADIQTSLHSDMLRYLWVEYAIVGGLWAALVHAGSLHALLNDHDAPLAAWRAGRECLEVVRRRGVVLSRYARAKPFLTNSPLRRKITMLMMRWVFRHDEYAKRCSAHAFGDPVEGKTFYDDLIATGHDLGVSMPVMESFAEDVRRFAN